MLTWLVLVVFADVLASPKLLELVPRPASPPLLEEFEAVVVVVIFVIEFVFVFVFVVIGVDAAVGAVAAGLLAPEPTPADCGVLFGCCWTKVSADA